MPDCLSENQGSIPCWVATITTNPPEASLTTGEVIHRNEENGRCLISRGGLWLPGVYENEVAAQLAFSLNVDVLRRLQRDANFRAGGNVGVITVADLKGTLQ